MKKKIKQILIGTLIASVFFLGLIQVFDNTIKAMEKSFTNFFEMQTDNYSIVVPKREEEVTEKELSMKEWVRRETDKAGLNWSDIDCLIFNESSWDPNGFLINSDGKSVDEGLWAINSYWHSEVSHVCNFDYKCQTKEAIRIIKANGNLHAWVGYNNNCR